MYKTEIARPFVLNIVNKTKVPKEVILFDRNKTKKSDVGVDIGYALIGYPILL